MRRRHSTFPTGTTGAAAARLPARPPLPSPPPPPPPARARPLPPPARALTPTRALVVALSLVSAAACYVGPIDRGTSSSPTEPSRPGEEGSSGGASPGSGDAAAASGLPCDVAELLASRCAGCHSTPLRAPVPLVTYEDMIAPSVSDPSRKVAEVAIARMRSTTRPMPPNPADAVPSPEIVAIEKWVAADYPRGTCGGHDEDAAASDGAARHAAAPPAVICTSGMTWTQNRRGPTMNPGRACIRCHEAQEDDPVVDIGGTVYPTFHEPDLCYGADGASTPVDVVITGADGQVFTLPVGPTGNFSKAFSGLTVQRPFRAKVVRGGLERAMSTPQTSGDCNGCHTATGANGAPGRIALP